LDFDLRLNSNTVEHESRAPEETCHVLRPTERYRASQLAAVYLDYDSIAQRSKVNDIGTNWRLTPKAKTK